MASAYEINLRRFHETNGSVTVFEEGSIPFPVRRTFLVEAEIGESRGYHAHKVCQQLLVAVHGEITIYTTNGLTESAHHLTNSNYGLVIPALVWATQHYVAPESRLLVVCDQLFDETDYIRDYEVFMTSVKASMT